MPKYFRAIPHDTILEDGEYLVQLGSRPGEFKVVGKLCPHPGPKEVKWREATTKDVNRPCRFPHLGTQLNKTYCYGLLVDVKEYGDGVPYGGNAFSYTVRYNNVLVAATEVEVEAC